MFLIPERGAMRFNREKSFGDEHGSISACHNEAGSFTLNEVSTDDFDICYGQLSASRDVTLFITAKHRFLGMLFNLGGDIELSASGFRLRHVPHAQYGLIYSPAIDVQVAMRKQHTYLFLSAGIRKEKRIEYFREVPIVSAFIRSMRDNQASYIGPPSGIVPHEVRKVVEAVARDFERQKFVGVVGGHLLNARMHELLNHVVKPGGWSATVKRIPQSEQRAVESIHVHLLAHLDSHPGTLQQMGQLAGMSSNRLNQRFKERYGATIFEFLKQARWEKVEELLGQNVALQDIASAVGYSSVSHFTAAFKKKYGISPGRARGKIS